MVKLKLKYTRPVPKWFIYLGIFLALGVAAQSIYLLVQKNLIASGFSAIFFLLLVWIISKRVREKNLIKEQTVEVDSYEEIKD